MNASRFTNHAPDAACREVIGRWSQISQLVEFAKHRHGYCNSDCGSGVVYPEGLDERMTELEDLQIPEGWLHVFAFQTAIPPGYELLVPEHLYLHVLSEELAKAGLMQQSSEVLQMSARTKEDAEASGQINRSPPAIHFNPTFLDQPQALFDVLKASIRWDVRMKARKTASFGVPYDYSQMSYAPRPLPPELADVAEGLSEELGFTPNNCLLNYYEDGQSSMGFHSDSSAELAAGTGVAIVSLGSVRSIVFRSKSDKTHEFSYALPGGSLLYMTQDIQDHWLHAIPKMEGASERISLTFRLIVRPAG